MPHYGYQGSFSEEVSEFELNYNEFELRTYDPQIGRWTTADPYDEFASPYLGMGTNPANLVDPDGGSVGGAILSFFGGGVSGSTASALAQVACPGMTATCTASAFVTGIRVATVSLAVGGATFSHFSGQIMSGHMSAMQGATGGSTIVKSSGALNGGGVNESGDDIGQMLNTQLSGNTGSEEILNPNGPSPDNPTINEEALNLSKTVIYYVFEAVTPQTYQHIKDATTYNFNNAIPKPLVLRYDGNPASKDKRRRKNLAKSGLPSSPDPWRDEYPFACTYEGDNASVRYVPKWEQEIQRTQLAGITRGLQDQDKIVVVLIPKLPPPVKAPVFRPSDVKNWKPVPLPVLSPEAVKTGAKIITGAAIIYGIWWLIKIGAAPVTGGGSLLIPI